MLQNPSTQLLQSPLPAIAMSPVLNIQPLRYTWCLSESFLHLCMWLPCQSSMRSFFNPLDLGYEWQKPKVQPTFTVKSNYCRHYLRKKSLPQSPVVKMCDFMRNRSQGGLWLQCTGHDEGPGPDLTTTERLQVLENAEEMDVEALDSEDFLPMLQIRPWTRTWETMILWWSL